LDKRRRWNVDFAIEVADEQFFGRVLQSHRLQSIAAILLTTHSPVLMNEFRGERMSRA
jgi:hypothetical protein